LLGEQTEPMLIVNGDILTEVDYRAMFAYHRENGAEMTVAVRRYEVQVPYGVVECEGSRVQSLREKPQLVFFVNAGIYLIEPTVFRLVPNNEHMNMTDLIDKLMQADKAVVSFPICEYWLDVGHHTDYARAQEDAKDGRFAAPAGTGGME
jgi:NDP-sugar pyrophosphorylase family protein